MRINKKYIVPILSLVTLVTPLLAFASTSMTLANVIDKIIGYLNQGLILIMGIAIIMFVWNVIQYFVKPNAESRKEANMYIMYSVIGFFVILSFWGIVKVVQNTFNLSGTSDRPTSWGEISNLFPTGSSGSSPANPSGGVPSFPNTNPAVVQPAATNNSGAQYPYDVNDNVPSNNGFVNTNPSNSTTNNGTTNNKKNVPEQPLPGDCPYGVNSDGSCKAAPPANSGYNTPQQLPGDCTYGVDANGNCIVP